MQSLLNDTGQVIEVLNHLDGTFLIQMNATEPEALAIAGLLSSYRGQLDQDIAEGNGLPEILHDTDPDPYQYQEYRQSPDLPGETHPRE